MKLITLSIAAAVMLIAGGAQAQYGPVAGEWELTLQGGGSSDNDFDNNAATVNAALGYYYTEAMEVVIRQGLNIVETRGTDFSGSTSVGLDYHFNMDRLRPFIGASVGAFYGEGVRNTFAAGPEAGVKYYVQPKTFIQGMVSYQFLFRNSNDIDDRFDDGAFIYSLGIGFNF